MIEIFSKLVVILVIWLIDIKKFSITEILSIACLYSISFHLVEITFLTATQFRKMVVTDINEYLEPIKTKM